MARIIEHESTGRMTNEIPQQEINPQVASTGGRILSDIGKGIEGASDQLLKAQLVSEEAKARNKTDVKLAKIKQEATMDPNLTPEKTAEYQTKMQMAVEEGSSAISIPGYRNQFKQKYETKAELESIKLNNLYFKKFRDEARANFKQQTAILGNDFINATTVSEKTAISGEYLAQMAEQTNAGWHTKEAAEKEIESTFKKWNESHLQYDVNTHPEWALEEMKKGDKGFYQGFDKTTISTYKKHAENNQKYLKAKFRNDIENEMIVKDTSGTLTAQDLEEGHLNGSVSRSFFEKMKNKIEGDYGPTANTDKQTYDDLTEKLVDPKTTPDQARVALIQASAEGKLSVADYEKLTRFHILPSEQGPQSVSDSMGGAKAEADLTSVKAAEDARSKELEDRNSWYKAGFNTLTGALGRDAHSVADAKMKLYDRIEKGNVKPQDIPHEAEAVIRENRVKKNPLIKNLPKEGAIVGDGWRYFPDGSAVKESKKNG